MDPAVLTAFNKLLDAWGAPGALFIVAGLVIKGLYARIQDLHEKRLAEARESAFQTMTLVRDLNKNMDGLTQAVNNLRDVVVTALKHT